MKNILLSWLGHTDLRAVTASDQVGSGPLAQAVDTGRFHRLELLCDAPADQVEGYLTWLRARTACAIRPHPVTLPRPTDFEAIYRHARALAAGVTAEPHADDTGLTFHLSPGTPAMAAVWIILAKTRFPAELIESSRQHGVRTVAVPFAIAADFLPDLLHRPDAELVRLAAGLPPPAPAFDDIVHQSPVMQRVVVRARRIALRSIPVLIEGESGTGKELFARAIHQAGPRRDRPLVTLNCGAIAPALIEAELFGHEKGAFTGAVSARQGVFEAADTGTLFLDEVGELPPPAQVRFLRAVQSGDITRVGATRSRRVDVRVIAATNRSLAHEVAAGRFREDLYYRLAVAVITLPAVRDREGDVALLLDRLLDQVNRESAGEPGYEAKILSVAARKRLLAHPWPGNVREMLNTLRRAAVWTPGPCIDLQDVCEALLPGPPPHPPPGVPLAQDLRQGIDLHETLAQIARYYLEQAMQQAGGNKTRAAQLLGFGNPTTLSNWLRKHGVAG